MGLGWLTLLQVPASRCCVRMPVFIADLCHARSSRRSGRVLERNPPVQHKRSVCQHPGLIPMRLLGGLHRRRLHLLRWVTDLRSAPICPSQDTQSAFLVLRKPWRTQKWLSVLLLDLWMSTYLFHPLNTEAWKSFLPESVDVLMTSLLSCTVNDDHSLLLPDKVPIRKTKILGKEPGFTMFMLLTLV